MLPRQSNQKITQNYYVTKHSNQRAQNIAAYFLERTPAEEDAARAFTLIK